MQAYRGLVRDQHEHGGKVMDRFRAEVSQSELWSRRSKGVPLKAEQVKVEEILLSMYTAIRMVMA